MPADVTVEDFDAGAEDASRLKPTKFLHPPSTSAAANAEGTAYAQGCQPLGCLEPRTISHILAFAVAGEIACALPCRPHRVTPPSSFAFWFHGLAPGQMFLATPGHRAGAAAGCCDRARLLFLPPFHVFSLAVCAGGVCLH